MDAIDWLTALYILSLDFIRPVYHELGVQVRGEETIKGLARDALSDRLAGSIANLHALNEEDTYSTHVVPFLEGTGRVFGFLGRQQVEYWAVTLSALRATIHGLFMRVSCPVGLRSTEETNRDEIGFSADPARIAVELKRASDLSVAATKLEEQRRKALTDWDLSLFSKLGLQEIPEGSDFFPLIDAIELTIAMHRFHTFWSWLASLIGSEDLDAIESYAKIRAGERKSYYVPPRDLPLLTA